MNIRTKNINKGKRIIPHIIFFTFFSVFIYVSQHFFKNLLFVASINFTAKINKNEQMRDLLPYFEQVANFFTTFQFYGIVMIFIFNTANIYKTYIFISSILISMLVSSSLKIIYQEPLMYYSENFSYENLIMPITCQAGWGSPSLNSATSTCVYLTFWKIIFDNNRLRFKKNTKIISLVCLILTIILINIGKFLAALHSFDQIIFGILVGFQIFYFLFYVLRVDLNNGKGLTKLVKFNFFYYILVNLAIIFIVLMIYFFNRNLEKEKAFNETINNSKCFNIHENSRFSNEAITLGMVFFANLGIFLGMKFELKYIFNNNEFNWRQYNFNKEDSEEESLFSKLSISKDTQWNHTTCFFTLMRLLASCIFHTILFLPMFLVSNDDNLAIVIIFKYVLTLNFALFFMFSIEKLFLYKLSLTNDSIFAMLSDSL